MKTFIFLALVVVCITITLTGWGNAQTAGPGIITINQGSCPSLSGMNQFPSNSHCFSGTISCSNVHSDVADIGFTFGAQGTSGTNGTIVLFSHGDGTTLDFDNTVLSNYNQAQFGTVEVIWQPASPGGLAPWEQSASGTGTVTTIIKHAACRPATLLNWIFSPGNINDGHIYGSGGKCAEGVSAGSAAIAYSMAQYNVNYLDAVEFLSGPPLSDISKGCGGTDQANVCSESFCHSAPLGMTPEGSWTDAFAYSQQEGAIDRWTNVAPHTCGNSNGSGPNYLDMSIVDNESDSTFHYPATAVSIWVCASPGNNSICNGSNPPANNSAAEADYFADQIAGFGSARALKLFRVDGCTPTNEDVGNGFVPAFYNGTTCPKGNTVIAHDMATECQAPPKHH
ncbi:MAG TPA: hypothetical protein VIH89_08225 [Candidatus Sulfotelmatobacter sp.]